MCIKAPRTQWCSGDVSSSAALLSAAPPINQAAKPTNGTKRSVPAVFGIKMG